MKDECKEGYTYIPNVYFDHIFPLLPKAELKLFIFFLRRTLGFGKLQDTIATNHCVDGMKNKKGTVLNKGAGISERSVQLAVHSLKKKGLIQIQKASRRGARTISIVWPPPLGKACKKPRNPYAFSVKKKYTNLHNTKETNTKKTKQHKQPCDCVVSYDMEKEKEIVKELVLRGLAETVAIEVANAYNNEYILKHISNFDDIKKYQQELVIKNPAGFLRKSIEENWAPHPHIEAKKKHLREKTARAKAAEEAEMRMREQDRLEKERLSRIKQLLDGMSEEERHALRSEAMEKLEQSGAGMKFGKNVLLNITMNNIITERYFKEVPR